MGSSHLGLHVGMCGQLGLYSSWLNTTSPRPSLALLRAWYVLRAVREGRARPYTSLASTRGVRSAARQDGDVRVARHSLVPRTPFIPRSHHSRTSPSQTACGARPPRIGWDQWTPPLPPACPSWWHGAARACPREVRPLPPLPLRGVRPSAYDVSEWRTRPAGAPHPRGRADLAREGVLNCLEEPQPSSA